MSLFWTDGDFIRFTINEKSGLFNMSYEGSEKQEYIEWLAEGNEPQEWTDAPI